MRVVLRYRTILLLGAPLGGLIGAVIGFALRGGSLMGSEIVLVGAIVGAVAACAAEAGGVLLILIVDRHLRMKRGLRAVIAGVGSGLGTVLIPLALVAPDLMGKGSLDGMGAVAWIGVILGVPASIVGALLVAHVDKRIEKTSSDSYT